MNVAGRDLTELSPRAAEKLYDDLVATVEGAPSEIGTAAYRIGQIPSRAIDGDGDVIDRLLAVAEVAKGERKAWRRKAEKALAKGRLALSYTVVKPGEYEHESAVDVELEKVRVRHEAAERFKAEGDDRPAIADAMLDYAALMDRPPLTPLVGGLLNVDTVAMLYAPPATYKTFLALWLAACVALGKKWAGRDVERGPVLYVAAEGVAGIQKRVAALSWLLNGGKPIPDLYIYPAPVNLTSAADVEELALLVADRRFRFVVFDTLVKVAGGAEENDNTAMTRVTNAAERIKRAGEGETTVLLVHHSGKSGDYRGASALEGNVDTMLKLEGDGALLTLSAVKQKDAEGGEVARLRAKPVAEHDTLVLEVVAPGDAQPSGVAAARVEEALAHFVRAFSETGATRSQFVDALVEWGVGGRSTVYSYVNELIKAGRLLVTGSASRSRLVLAPERVTFDPETDRQITKE